MCSQTEESRIGQKAFESLQRISANPLRSSGVGMTLEYFPMLGRNRADILLHKPVFGCDCFLHWEGERNAKVVLIHKRQVLEPRPGGTN